MAAPVVGAGVYPISGVRVEFPCKPYSTQLQMMSKIIQALNKGQNALLESPTGTGKSLALLCATLAWKKQAMFYPTADPSQYNDDQTLHSHENGSLLSDSLSKKESDVQNNLNNDLSNFDGKQLKRVGPQTNLPLPLEKKHKPMESSFDISSKASNSSVRHSQQPTAGSTNKIVYIDYSSDESVDQTNMPDVESSKDSNSGNIRVPSPSHKIYYGTRTHSQITQITHELARTAYSSTPMVVLASREHTCIHPHVSVSNNKNEDCRKLILYKEGISCPYYHKVQQKLGQQAKMKEYGYTGAWDIEDLVTLGKRIKACPFYATRALLDEAEIVFCPYNYLISSLIRQQLRINLQSSVLIFDEAHNMEDVARDAASLTVNSLQLKELQDELHKITQMIPFNENYHVIMTYVYHILNWMTSTANDFMPRGISDTCSIWSGSDFKPHLKTIGITPETSQKIMSHVQAIIDDNYKEQEKNNEDDDDNDSYEPPKLSSATLHVLESLFIILLNYFFKHVDDYRVALKKSSTFAKKPLDGWMKRKSSGFRDKVEVISLCFWCLNPAVAFSDLTNVHSIILTSGTLSPMNSFSSELGALFPIQLEASHIINKSQTWIQSISCGPNGHLLNATYQYTETLKFQDELGEVILNICNIVPFGVLCFFSSYSLLEKVTNRWKDTTTWGRILQRKHIVCESRSSDMKDIVSEFCGNIESATQRSLDTTQDGALFFAVCRGKVSEGIDFSDDNARAVIAVGIPFPNFKDEQVTLKREYNDSLHTQNGLLSGSEWYEMQAYRALNQALGRCIRHKNDWGALILIDERYSKGARYTRKLSKWVRQRLQTCRGVFSDVMESLEQFVDAQSQTKSNTTLCNVDKTVTEVESVTELSRTSPMDLSTLDQTSTSTNNTISNNHILPMNHEHNEENYDDDTLLYYDSDPFPSPQSLTVSLASVVCHCGSTLSDDFKDDVLSGRIEHIITSNFQTSLPFQSSTLSSLFTANQIVYILPNSLINSQVKSRTAGGLNAIWDDGLGLCYSVLECKNCSAVMGISVNYSKTDSLQGKVLLQCQFIKKKSTERNN